MTSRGRSHFLPTDDKALLDFLIDQLRQGNPVAKCPAGNELWKLARDENITGHSFQAMRDRMRRQLLPYLDIKSTALISETGKTFLKKKLSVYFNSPRRSNHKRRKTSTTEAQSRDDEEPSMDDDDGKEKSIDESNQDTDENENKDNDEGGHVTEKNGDGGGNVQLTNSANQSILSVQSLENSRVEEVEEAGENEKTMATISVPEFATQCTAAWTQPLSMSLDGNREVDDNTQEKLIIVESISTPERMDTKDVDLVHNHLVEDQTKFSPAGIRFTLNSMLLDKDNYNFKERNVIEFFVSAIDKLSQLSDNRRVEVLGEMGNILKDA